MGIQFPPHSPTNKTVSLDWFAPSIEAIVKDVRKKSQLSLQATCKQQELQKGFWTSICME